MKKRTIKNNRVYHVIAVFLMFSLHGCSLFDKNDHSNIDRKEDTHFHDNVIKHKVDSLLKLMTLEEKIGQLVLYSGDNERTGPSMPNDYLDKVAKGKCGNVFNVFTAASTRKLQKIAVEKTRLGIPLLIGLDVVHGYKTIFPVPLGEASTWDMDAIEKAARIAAEEASSAGVNWVFAPVADVSRDPRWGRICEGSGEDPYLSSCVVIAKVKGFQGHDLSADNTVLACLKHFAGYGASMAGRDYNPVEISYKSFMEDYLPPYKAAVDAGVGSVMTSFNDLFGIPSTCNKMLLKDILKDQLKFNGFIVTDYTAIMELKNHGVAINNCHAAAEALLAGVDVDMQSGYYEECLQDLVKKGEITEEMIDQSVRNVLGMKFRLGLFDDPYRYCNEEREKTQIYAKDHLEFSREIARKSFVLLKNANGILPLQKNRKIAIIGPLADSKKVLIGSWCAQGDWEFIPSVREALVEEIGEQNVLYSKGCEVSGEDKSLFAEAVSKASMADIILLALGESPEMTGEAASRSEIDIPGVQPELLRELKRLNKPIVVLLFNGRPLVLSNEIALCDAMLDVWFPGTEGAHAIMDIIYGRYNPSGKLTVSFPRNVGQIPVFYNHKNTGRPFDKNEKYTSKYLDVENSPLFPFGFGLSYTSFVYSDLRLSTSIIKMDESLEASIRIKNTGKYDGEEIVQLFVRDMVATTTRPVKELKGFKKVFLKTGESTTISFSVRPDQLFYLTKNNIWGIEEGEFKLFIGPNSEDLLSESFWIVK